MGTSPMKLRRTSRFNWPQGAAFGFMLLILSTGIVWLGLRLTGQGFSETLRRS